MDAIVQAITENYDIIDTILKKKEGAEKHIEEQINAAFLVQDYIKKGKWFRREDKKFDLYFYIPPASELMRTDSLWLCFEIRNETNDTINKPAFIEHFRNEFKELNNFKQGELASAKHHTHAFIYQEYNFFKKGISFSLRFEEVLQKLINVDNAPVKRVEKYLEERNHYLIG